MLLGSVCIFIIRSFGQSCVIWSVGRRWRNASFSMGSTGVTSDSLLGDGYVRKRQEVFYNIDSASGSGMYSDFGAHRHEAMMRMEQGGMNSCSASPGLLWNSCSLGNGEVEDIFGSSQQGVGETNEVLSDLESDEEAEDVYGRFLPGLGETTEVLSDFGSDKRLAESEDGEQNLEAKLQEASYSLEEWEGMVQIRLMVVEAVWKGVVRAIEDEALAAAEVREAELRKAKQELQSKDAMISDLIQALKVEESTHRDIQGKLENEGDDSSYYPSGKDGSLRRCQEEVELRNSQIRELTLARQIVEKERIHHDAEKRCQVMIIVAKHLLDKIGFLNSKLLENEDASNLTHVQMQEQNWRHEAEISVIMTTLEGRARELHSKLREYEEALQLAGAEIQEQSWRHEAELSVITTVYERKVVDFETEVTHFLERVLSDQSGTVSYESQIVQRLGLFVKDLRASKETLESRLEHAETALRSLETSSHAEHQELVVKTTQLNDAESRIATLEHKLFEKEMLIQKLLQKSEQSYLEAEVESLEEKVWLISAEKALIETYMETAFEDFRTTATATTSASIGIQGIPPRSRDAPDGTYVNTTDVLGRISSGSTKDIQESMGENVREFSEVQIGSFVNTPESDELKGDLREQQVQSGVLEKKFEDKVPEEEEEVTGTNTQEALSENLQRQVEDAVLLNCVESLCQQTEEIRQQLEKNARKDAEDKSKFLEVLEWELSHLRNQIVLLTNEVTSLNGQLKVGFEGQLQTVTTSIERLEGDVCGKFKQFDSRIQQGHDSLREMRKMFDGQFQSVMSSMHLLEGNFSDKVEDFDSRIQGAHETLRTMKAGFENQLQNVLTSMQRLEGDLSERVGHLGSRIEQAHDTLSRTETGLEGQVQTLMAYVQRLEGSFTLELERFDSRLQHADCKLKLLSHQHKVSAAKYVEMAHDLQKAETEVDYLGDEVDVLMDLLEKVHAMLRHYHPVIQLYPGLADVSKRVSQEVLQRVCRPGGV